MFMYRFYHGIVDAIDFLIVKSFLKKRLKGGWLPEERPEHRPLRFHLENQHLDDIAGGAATLYPAGPAGDRHQFDAARDHQRSPVGDVHFLAFFFWSFGT